MLVQHFMMSVSILTPNTYMASKQSPSLNGHLLMDLCLTALYFWPKILN